MGDNIRPPRRLGGEHKEGEMPFEGPFMWVRCGRCHSEEEPEAATLAQARAALEPLGWTFTKQEYRGPTDILCPYCSKYPLD